jgi:hypothetical protein
MFPLQLGFRGLELFLKIFCEEILMALDACAGCHLPMLSGKWVVRNGKLYHSQCDPQRQKERTESKEAAAQNS